MLITLRLLIAAGAFGLAIGAALTGRVKLVGGSVAGLVAIAVLP